MNEGIFSALLWNWKPEIHHNNRENPDKILRYLVGFNRYSFLKKNAIEFGISTDKVTGEQIVAYLVRLTENDLDPRMPTDTKYEYICGKRTDTGEYQIFSYIWFNSLVIAKKYAKSHDMRILGGWGNK